MVSHSTSPITVNICPNYLIFVGTSRRKPNNAFSFEASKKSADHHRFNAVMAAGIGQEV
jgi:hypothetical protein